MCQAALADAHGEAARLLLLERFLAGPVDVDDLLAAGLAAVWDRGCPCGTPHRSVRLLVLGAVARCALDHERMRTVGDPEPSAPAAPRDPATAPRR